MAPFCLWNYYANFCAHNSLNRIFSYRTGDGVISYTEFVKAAYLPRTGGQRANIVDILDDKLTQLVWEASRSESELMRLFQKFDRRGTGRVSRRDFRSAIEKLGLRGANTEHIDELLDRLDINGDGLLDYAEFVDAALVGAQSGRSGRGSPRARRWGRQGGRSLSPTRRIGGGFDYSSTTSRPRSRAGRSRRSRGGDMRRSYNDRRMQEDRMREADRRDRYNGSTNRSSQW